MMEVWVLFPDQAYSSARCGDIVSVAILALDAVITALVDARRMAISMHGVSSNCGVGITPHTCNRVTNP